MDAIFFLNNIILSSPVPEDYISVPRLVIAASLPENG